MKKHCILFSFVLISSYAIAQVGIDTANPQGVFNIDGGKDNPKSGNAHTDAQQLNDVTVLANGNVGIGTINPTHKLHIVSGGTTTIPVNGFKLTDGNQGDQKILTAIDANGTGTWQTLNSAKILEVGEFLTTTPQIYSDETTVASKYVQTKITLSPGVWIVNLGVTVYYNTDGANGSFENPYWLHVYLSTSNTSNTKSGYTPLGPSGNNSGYAGVMMKTASTDSPNFVSGSMVIRVTGNDPKPLYVWFENRNLVLPATSGNMWRFDTTSSENYLYAIPLNE